MNSANDRLLDVVRETIADFALFAPGDTILAAVSGGADSVCLLHVLVELGKAGTDSRPRGLGRSQSPLSPFHAIEVAYFDHETRDGASAEDGAFVAALAKDLGLPCHTERRPVASEAQEKGLGFEEYARQVRYDFLTRTALNRGCNIIATGHNADDQAETVLMRILRGAGLTGAAGIPPVRHENGIGFARPLIRCTRAEIEAYLEARRIAWRTDVTNADTRYHRNRVRHELLPLLRGVYNPNVDEALRRFADILRTDAAFIEWHADAAYARCVSARGAIDRREFAAFHPTLQRRVVMHVARRAGVACPFERVEAAIRFVVEGATGAELDLGNGVVLTNTRAATETVAPQRLSAEEAVSFQVPGVAEAFGRRFEALYREGVPEADLAAYCTPTRQVFDADAVGDVLTIRTRRPGDRFVPLGMSGTKKLKDYFIDLGVPARDRDRELVLLGARGIIWIVGRAVAAPAAITKATQRVVEVRISDAIG
ncbi:MAG TPA: tRNA lysidine(34) synthetase TilS [Candidatus Hydrogenedentes bacterium]|nr:tRNA lysidine(34) synthetase TilS [Candidatus Hydrogenedentota bacterium]HPG70285.1 tRNA lysidine(34) synthetase TilS [Candidatus Hydrogenedentota bacterium]